MRTAARLSGEDASFVYNAEWQMCRWLGNKTFRINNTAAVANEMHPALPKIAT
jgi:hypothetical protein